MICLKVVDSLPRVACKSPSDFFQDLETQDVFKLLKWKGVLYLELH